MGYGSELLGVTSNISQTTTFALWVHAGLSKKYTALVQISNSQSFMLI